MPRAATCPDLQDLQRFVLGQSPEADAERLELHLSRCDECLATLHTLQAADTLVEAVRAQAGAPDEPDNGTVADLIERAQGLRPPPAASAAASAAAAVPLARQPSEEVTSATPLPNPLPSAPEVTTDAVARAAVAPPAEPTEEVYDFLAPAQGPDEIGRLGPYRVLKVL